MGFIYLYAIVSEYAKFLWCLLDEYQLLEIFIILKVGTTFLSMVFKLKTRK